MVLAMGISAAQKMARNRERVRRDEAVLLITVKREPLAAMLIDAGLLSLMADDDSGRWALPPKYIAQICLLAARHASKSMRS